MRVTLSGAGLCPANSGPIEEGMNVNFQKVAEECQVMGANLVEKVKELIHEGNVQRIIIKNEQGHTLVEITVTLAAIGIIAAPVMAAVGAIAAAVVKCTFVVERREPPAAQPPTPPPAS